MPARLLFLLLLAALLLPGPAARADERTRQIQEELRRRHLFYRDIDGQNSPELVSALRQYQERQGFAASGEPDEPTLRSLGVAMNTPPAPPAEGPSLPDEAVLKSDLALQNTGREPAGVLPTPPPAQTVVNASPATRKEIHSFLQHYFEASQSPNIGDEIGFYADRVEYYDHGTVDRTYIENELIAYNQRWPTRKYSLGNQLRLKKSGDKTIASLRVSFAVKSERRNKTARGRTDVTVVLVRRPDSGFAITSIEEERVARRARGHRSGRWSNPVPHALHRVHGAVRRLLHF